MKRPCDAAGRQFDGAERRRYLARASTDDGTLIRKAVLVAQGFSLRSKCRAGGRGQRKTSPAGAGEVFRFVWRRRYSAATGSGTLGSAASAMAISSSFIASSFRLPEAYS